MFRSINKYITNYLDVAYAFCNVFLQVCVDRCGPVMYFVDIVVVLGSDQPLTNLQQVGLPKLSNYV